MRCRYCKRNMEEKSGKYITYACRCGHEQVESNQHTFREWNDLGYVVRKGEKSTTRNALNISTFSSEQVKLKERPKYCYGNLDDDMDDDPMADPYYGCECF